MVIDRDRKYIFVGLFFSGSSAISKELLTEYGAEPLMAKHTTMPYLMLRNAEIRKHIKEYQVVAVVRDPVQMTFSKYQKLKSNHSGIYTDEKSYVKNGGWLTEKDRQLFHLVYYKGGNFNAYLKSKYQNTVYNNDLTINTNYITRTLRFDNLANDFKEWLNSIGIVPKRDLPVFNKTEKKETLYELPYGTEQEIFGPFLWKNRKHFQQTVVEPRLGAKVHFAVQNQLQTVKKLWFDRNQELNYSAENFWD